jgi:hypothetical protein
MRCSADMFSMTLMVDNSRAGRLIGQKGATLSSLKASSHVQQLHLGSEQVVRCQPLFSRYVPQLNLLFSSFNHSFTSLSASIASFFNSYGVFQLPNQLSNLSIYHSVNQSIHPSIYQSIHASLNLISGGDGATLPPPHHRRPSRRRAQVLLSPPYNNNLTPICNCLDLFCPHINYSSLQSV